jgi:hypothetical protein
LNALAGLLHKKKALLGQAHAWKLVSDDWYQPSLPRETLIAATTQSGLWGNWIFVLFLGYYMNSVPLWVTP